MRTFSQSPTDPAFVQNPYPFYDEIRGNLSYWKEYEMPSAFSYSEIDILFKNRKLGREPIKKDEVHIPQRLQPFYDIEAHSMLELEPPRHTHLRKMVLHAFTSRRIAALGPEIENLCHALIDDFPCDPFDILSTYATQVPVIVIARLLGVPVSMAPQLLRWSNDMVMMYQARRTPELEDQAVKSTLEFSSFMATYIEERRSNPADDLISHLIAAEEDGEHLTRDEVITTCILLLNAGHEATVHTLGNGIKALIEHGAMPEWFTAHAIAGTVEEILRYDPPLHMFTRYVYDDVTVGNHTLSRGDQVALMIGASGRDPERWTAPNQFDPSRAVQKNHAFGAGIHFCLGAPLARMEMQIALKAVFERHPNLRITSQPKYANVYHFHGLEALWVQT
jgi:unspecific monooxygenase